ncbi:MAG TPA: bifunctional phosphopantothenoylcysteine decarboxylase/phosphopantothenate--cysteine ligase CoaBC [Flavobacteriaceae bacterium]|nr:bifunctional phosphopantothenoylcysteine decarboxylase/phosphopantothenate--cysteine ligase CoaBC [Flavobacteriaceae bacterium]
MSILSGKKILLGISGGIAAYKTAILVRLFIKNGAEVKVVMTPDAKEFITPLTLSTLSKNPVHSSFTSDDQDETWNNHVELGMWADLILICPATANTLSKMANGNCDNLLIAVYLSAKCPVYFAPAMDLDMYKHQSTKDSISKLLENGNILIPAETGELASGLIGEGRLAEPDSILNFIEADIIKSLPLRGKKILVTAGPTYEAIDPVRYISNHSSGKMGFEIAKKASDLGAEVFLISGPSNQKISTRSINLINVVSSKDMHEEVIKYYSEVDIVIMAAAVSDFKPKDFSNKKIKKDNIQPKIELKKTKDILLELGRLKKNQFLVGFALENENEIENSLKKLKNKNLDLIILNSLNDKGAGFGTETNKITIINSKEEKTDYDLKDKSEVAEDILNSIMSQINV